MSRRISSLILAFVATPSAATAHDFWIEPDAFRPVPGATVALVLRVGHAGEVETFPRDPSHLRSFICVDESGRRDVDGLRGKSPAGELAARVVGPIVVAYESQPRPSTLEPAKFDDYLRAEGLESIIEERRVRNESDLPGRERYSRCAKTVLRVEGDGAANAAGVGALFGRALGMPVEIVPEVDPTAITPGASIAVQLLSGGAPMAGALVRLEPLDAAEPRSAARTDAAGRVTLPVPRAGRFRVATVRVRRATDGGVAEWETHFASLTFESRAVSAR